jgi:hypothetical protein
MPRSFGEIDRGSLTIMRDLITGVNQKRMRNQMALLEMERDRMIQDEVMRSATRFSQTIGSAQTAQDAEKAFSELNTSLSRNASDPRVSRVIDDAYKAAALTATRLKPRTDMAISLHEMARGDAGKWWERASDDVKAKYGGADDPSFFTNEVLPNYLKASGTTVRMLDEKGAPIIMDASGNRVTEPEKFKGPTFFKVQITDSLGRTTQGQEPFRYDAEMRQAELERKRESTAASRRLATKESWTYDTVDAEGKKSGQRSFGGFPHQMRRQLSDELSRIDNLVVTSGKDGEANLLQRLGSTLGISDLPKKWEEFKSGGVTIDQLPKELREFGRSYLAVKQKLEDVNNRFESALDDEIKDEEPSSTSSSSSETTKKTSTTNAPPSAPAAAPATGKRPLKLKR